MPEVLETFWLHDDAPTSRLSDGHRVFATTLANGVVAAIINLDPVVAEATEHWRLERMNVIDRMILRLAVYELLYETATPAPVIINEALELAHTFSDADGVRFVNGVLDAIRRRLERA